MRRRYRGENISKNVLPHRQSLAQRSSLGFPARRLGHPFANQDHEQRRHAADHEHPSPAEPAADKIIGQGGQKKSEVIARVHHARAHGSPLFRPLFRDQRRADPPFSADADSGKKPKHGEHPDVRGKRAQQSKKRKTNNGEHQGADAPKPVGDRPPQESHPPSNQEQGEQNSAVISDIGGRRGNSRARQQVAQRRNQNERVDEGIHAIQHPSAPGRPEPADLIWRQRDSSRCHLRMG